MSKVNKSILAVLLVLVLLTMACGTSSTAKKVGEVEQPVVAEEEKSQPTEPQPAAEKPATEPAKPATPTSYKVGDIVSIGEVNLAVLGWSYAQGNDFSKPDEGKKFVLVELIILNNSSSAESISGLLQMSLKDETGQKFDVDIMASTVGKGGLDGELAPGEKIRGDVGFQVPADAKGLVFVYDADIFGSGKVFVELGAEPGVVEPPAEMAGEKAQQTYKIGDVIEIGTISLVVNGVSAPTNTDFVKPDEGNKFVAVDVTVQNNSTEAASISSLLQMELKDASGQSYEVDIMASTAAGSSTLDGELAPGEKLRGQVGYQVPNTTTGLVFVFDASVFGSGKVFVALE